MRLLIIEDNVGLAWRLQAFLEKQFEIQITRTGAEGQRLARTGRYDIILLDLRLPDINGDEICEGLRNNGITTPILVVSAEYAVEAKVQLLETGADDYLTKPFEPIELMARINALLRRRQAGSSQAELQISDLQINLNQRTVKRGGIPITLRRKEFDLLEYLVRSHGKVVTQTMILNYVWGEFDKDVWSNTVRVHIKHLRDKIDRGHASPLIKTMRGVGYIIDEP